MKFVITESKFRTMADKHVLDKLDKLRLNPIEKDDGIYRIDFHSTSKIEPNQGAFRWENGILEVSPSILDFCKPFVGLEGVGDYGIIVKWFMINYGLGVDWIWEWTDQSP